MARKKDLIKKLVEEYGYEEAELKNLTNAKLTSLIKKEEKEAKELEEQEKKEALKTKQIDRHELIEVGNGTMGGLIIRSPRTGMIWKFTEFGQRDYIEYQELESLRNRSPKLFTEGSLIILNDNVVKKFRLQEIYKYILSPEYFEQIFKKDIKEIEDFIDKAPKAMLQTFVSIAIEFYKTGKLNDIRIIRLIENKFNIVFEDLA